MRKTLIVCLSLFSFWGLNAQTKWSLRQCIDYAVEHNIEIKQQALQVQNSEVELSTAKNSRLPDLNAGVNQSFNFGQSIAVSSNTSVKGTTSNTRFSLSSATPLFTGFRIPNEIKVKELNLSAATENLNKAKDDIQLQVASIYLEVLFKKEILRVYEEQRELTKIQVSRTETLVEAGKNPMSQVYDIKAQLAKDELNATTAKNDLDLALLNLSQLLNLSEYTGFDVVEPDLEDAIGDNISSILPVNEIYQRAIMIKPHVKEAEYKLQSSEKNLKVAQSGYYPTLNLDLNAGTSFDHAFNNKVTNVGIGRQMDDYKSASIGFTLSIPIFNRFQTRNQVRSARINIQNSELVLDNVKLALYKEIQQAYQSATAAQAKYTSTEKAFLAAQESFKYARERYEVGKTSVFEYNEAQTKLLTSKSEQLQAKYDFVFRAKILDFYNGKEIDI